MTKATSFVFAASFTIVVLGPARVAAADVFSDRLCPRASAPVTAYAALAKNADSAVDSVIAAARDAAAAYEICGREDLAAGATEALHYTQVREAQFYVAIGRLQRLTDARDEARKTLQTAIDLTKDSIGWTTSSQSVYRSNNVGVGSGSVRGGSILPSMYHDNAVAIRDAATREIEKISGASSPSAAATALPEQTKP
ncbi:MAG: hypothetical protein NVSMB64_32340 [Candidatus Velthaea sp.]